MGCKELPPPVGRYRSMAGLEAGLRQVPLRPEFWGSSSKVEEEGGGGVYLKGRGGIPFLPEDVEDHTVFPLGRVTLMREARNLVPQIQRWVARTRVITTVLFKYLQVSEYGSFHFSARRLAMRVSVAFTLTPRRTST